MNQSHILRQIFCNQDIIWNASCNAGESIAYFGPAIAFALNLLRTRYPKFKVFLLEPTTSIIYSIKRESHLLPCRVVTPGHGTDLKMTLQQALTSNAQLVIANPAKFVSMCGIGPNGKPKWDSVDERLACIRDVQRTVQLGENICLVVDEVHTFSQCRTLDLKLHWRFYRSSYHIAKLNCFVLVY